MKRNLKVLFPTDFSLGSRKAGKTILELGKHYKLDIHLQHGIRSFWKNWFSSGDYKREIMARLETWQKKYCHTTDRKKMTTSIGNPCEAIIDTSKELDVDLIVMGGTSHVNAGRYRTGMCAENTVRYSSVPVWICNSGKISKVLCAIDLSRHSKKTIKYAISICKAFSLDLDVLYVYPSYSPPFGMDDMKVRREEDKNSKICYKKLKEFIDSIKDPKVQINILFQQGLPANNILDMAEDEDYDLVVVGAHGEGGLSHLLLGSTAEKVLRHIPCSLLVVE